MRRFIYLIAVVAAVAAMMVLPGTALADATNGSCFDDYARTPGFGPPGEVVSSGARGLSGPPTGNEGVVQAFQDIKDAVTQGPTGGC